MRVHLPSVFLSAMLLATPAWVVAAPCTSYEDCVARMVAANGSQDFAAAQLAAEAAYAFHADAILLHNLGKFHHKQGHLKEAQDYYQRYLDSRDSSLTPSVQAEVSDTIRELREKLSQPPAPPPPAPAGTVPRLTWRTYAGLPAATLGLGLLALGGVALGLDGQCRDGARPCDMRYDSQAEGIGTLVAGAVLFGVGVTFGALDGYRRRHHRDPPREAVALGPGRG